MSQLEASDLLCRSRREELSADEQRRLSECLEYSFELKLMSEILSELEKESRVRPGDDLMLARINARALGSFRISQRAPAKRRRLSMLLVAAAVLLVAGLAGAWLGGARQRRAPESPSSLAKPKSSEVPRSVPSSLPSIPNASLMPQVTPELDTPIAPAPVPSASVPTRPSGREPKSVSPSSASELFLRANLLRRQGRAGEASVLYELLLDLYPNAREVGPTRLALGKYLQLKQPERALAQYRAAAGAGGALRAEALWGISETATNLGERSVSEQALADLLHEFPDSPYAEVARARTSHGLR